jgi:hypothetical protein
MARALIGHDFGGVDNKGVMLKRGALPTAPVLDNFKDPDPTNGNKPGVYSDRKGTYLDPQVFVRDDDPQMFPGVAAVAQGPYMGRIVVIDKYNFPVLYYRANSRARYPFGITGGPGDQGVYNQADNAAFTGGTATYIDASDGASNTQSYPNSWDFAVSGSAHGLGHFGVNSIADYMPPPDSDLDVLEDNASGTDGNNLPYKGKTFINYFHSHNTHASGNVAKAQNPDTFFLISAGKDGVYGTDDDVSNSRGGGL